MRLPRTPGDERIPLHSVPLLSRALRRAIPCTNCVWLHVLEDVWSSWRQRARPRSSRACERSESRALPWNGPVVARASGPGHDFSRERRLRPVLDLGEDVRLAEAGLADGIVAPVGPHRVHGVGAGREPVVVADEGATGEEPLGGVPVPGADLGAVEARRVIARHRLPRVDPHVGWVEPAVEPDHVEAPRLVRGGPREELVVAGGLAG